MKRVNCLVIIVLGLLLTTSCIDELEIKNDYDFKVEYLPVPKRLKKGETAEIRFEIVRSGRFADAKYYVRYFQPDGSGDLRLDGQVLIPNDSYELRRETFRMYYTSQSEEQEVIDLTFYDNFRNRFDVTFVFANDTRVEVE